MAQMKNSEQQQEDNFSNINYRELYFKTSAKIADVIEILIDLQQQMEEVHMSNE